MTLPAVRIIRMTPPRDSTCTSELLERVRAGDRVAFDQLFARHRDTLRQAIALRLDKKLRARVDPSDVLQETQIDAFQRLDDYLQRRPMPFKLWLQKAAHERLIKVREHHREAARRSVEREVPLPDQTSLELFHRLCGIPSAAERLPERRDLVRTVRQVLADLSEEDREILLMRYLEKLSNQEIGHLLDLDPGTVSKRHGRALLRLQKLLRAHGVGESNL
jgi:RNA polymerase sigma-70 factor (ECF subfamily)